MQANIVIGLILAGFGLSLIFFQKQWRQAMGTYEDVTIGASDRLIVKKSKKPIKIGKVKIRPRLRLFMGGMPWARNKEHPSDRGLKIAGIFFFIFGLIVMML